MKETWEWLNGKKTVIGTILLMVCGIPHIEEYIKPDFIDMLYYTAVFISGGGIIHKAVKHKRD